MFQEDDPCRRRHVHLCACIAPTASAQTYTGNLKAVGLTANNELVSFSTGAPRLSSRSIGTISGTLAADSEIVGIDYRVQDAVCTPSAVAAASTSSTPATRPRPSSTS